MSEDTSHLPGVAELENTFGRLLQSWWHSNMFKANVTYLHLEEINCAQKTQLLSIQNKGCPNDKIRCRCWQYLKLDEINSAQKSHVSSA